MSRNPLWMGEGTGFAARARAAAIEALADPTWGRCPHLLGDESFDLAVSMSVIYRGLGGPRPERVSVRALSCLAHRGGLRCRECMDEHERMTVHDCDICAGESATARVETGSDAVAVCWHLCRQCWNDIEEEVRSRQQTAS
jgi:hypothetical protein